MWDSENNWGVFLNAWRMISWHKWLSLLEEVLCWTSYKEGRGNQGCEAWDYCGMVRFRFPRGVRPTAKLQPWTVEAQFFFPRQGLACHGVMKGCFGSQSGLGELVHTQYCLLRRNFDRVLMYRADEHRYRFSGDGVYRDVIRETKALLVLTIYWRMWRDRRKFLCRSWICEVVNLSKLLRDWKNLSALRGPAQL